MNPVAKLLIVAGVVLVVVGLLWQVGGKFISLGRLPGDIVVEKENFRFYFPITSSILLSILLTLIFSFFRLFR